MSGGGGMSVARRFGIRCSPIGTGLAEQVLDVDCHGDSGIDRCGPGNRASGATDTRDRSHTPAETRRLLRPSELDDADWLRQNYSTRSISEMAEELGVSEAAVQTAMVRLGVERRARGETQVLKRSPFLDDPEQLAEVLSTTHVSEIAADLGELSRRARRSPAKRRPVAVAIRRVDAAGDSSPTRRSFGRGRPRRRSRVWHVGSRRIIDSVSRRISAAVTPSDGSSPTSCHDPTSHR